MIFSLPFVFEPLPLSVPLLSAPKTAAVAGTSLLGTIKSFHWSANVPPIAPANALINPIFYSSLIYIYYILII